MKEVAIQAGVSRSTASYALSGRQEGVRIPEETRRHIIEVAVALGYQPNELARAVVTGRSRLIGILNYDNERVNVSEFGASIIAGTLNEALSRGYSTKLLNFPFDATPEQVKEVVERCSSWRLDGVISVALQDETSRLLYEETKTHGCPIAFIESYVPWLAKEGQINIATDDYHGILAAVEHLFQLGHRQITFLSGPVEREITQQRNQIFLQVLNEFGLPVGPDTIVDSHWSARPVIEKSVHHALDLPDHPTALLCAGDATAMVAMRVARQRGLTVPDDLSVIGFGNFAMASYADPPLTTIGQSFREMGRLAMKTLLDRIESAGTTTLLNLVPASLVVRESTAPPPTSRFQPAITTLDGANSAPISKQP